MLFAPDKKNNNNIYLKDNEEQQEKEMVDAILTALRLAKPNLSSARRFLKMHMLTMI